MLSCLFLRRSRRRAAVCALAAASLVFFYSGDISLADERDDAVAKQNEAQRKQQQVMSSLEGVSADLGQAYISLQNAQASLSTAETQLTTAETNLAAKEREQQIASDRLTTAQNSLETVKKESEASKKTAEETSDSVAEIVVSTYQGDNSVTSWSYVLASQDVEELSQRASAVEIGSGVQEAGLSAAEGARGAHPPGRGWNSRRGAVWALAPCGWYPQYCGRPQTRNGELRLPGFEEIPEGRDDDCARIPGIECQKR